MTNAKPSIAILDDYYHRATLYADWSNAAFAKFTFFDKPFASQSHLIETLQQFHAVGLMRERTPFPATVIRQLPNLQLIVTSGMKNAAIDLSAATENNVTVCGTQSPGHATAELAFLLIMSLARQLIPLANALQQHSEWQPVMGQDLRGKTLGILGLGRLGTQLAGFAKAMDMHVIAWSENLKAETCHTQDVEYVTRQQLFERSDFVSIHLRHSERTHHLVNEQDLKQLGPESYLINTSRAEIIHPEHLKAALDDNTIAGAATDVFATEPATSDNWMVGHPKMLATPHIGYCTQETFSIFYQQMLEAFDAYYTGSPVRVLS